jgi:trehalose-6-phosphate synthase
MKNLRKLKFVAVGILMLLISCTGEQKKEHANKEFCEHLTSFSKALDNLDVASEGTNVNEFNREYDKAAREWNKLVISAEKLDNIEIDESVKAYNKLANSVTKIVGETITADTADEINKNIDTTTDKINYLMTTECKN